MAEGEGQTLCSGEGGAVFRYRIFRMCLGSSLLLSRNVARRTQLAAGRPHCKINVVATHMQGDDDLACAEFIRDALLGVNAIRLEDIAQRIKDSRPAQKVFDAAILAFNEKQIAFFTREVPCDCVMQIDKSQAMPRIIRQPV